MVISNFVMKFQNVDFLDNIMIFFLLSSDHTATAALPGVRPTSIPEFPRRINVSKQNKDQRGLWHLTFTVIFAFVDIRVK